MSTKAHQQRLSLMATAEAAASLCPPDQAPARIWLDWIKKDAMLRDPALAQKKRWAEFSIYAGQACASSGATQPTPSLDRLLALARDSASRGSGYDDTLFRVGLAHAWIAKGGVESVESAFDFLGKTTSSPRPDKILAEEIDAWRAHDTLPAIANITPASGRKLCQGHPGAQAFLLETVLDCGSGKRSSGRSGSSIVDLFAAMCDGSSPLSINHAFERLVRRGCGALAKAVDEEGLLFGFQGLHDALRARGASWTTPISRSRHRSIQTSETPLTIALSERRNASMAAAALRDLGAQNFWPLVEAFVQRHVGAPIDPHRPRQAAWHAFGVISCLRDCPGMPPTLGLRLLQACSTAVWTDDPTLVDSAFESMATRIADWPAQLRSPWLLPGFADPGQKQTNAGSSWPTPDAPFPQPTPRSWAALASAAHFDAPSHKQTLSAGLRLLDGMRANHFPAPWAEDLAPGIFNPKMQAFMEAWQLRASIDSPARSRLPEPEGVKAPRL